MKKIAVVYWSGTGNTKEMANAIVAGIREEGVEADMFTSGNFDASMIAQYTGIAFGCPSMGAEELEETEFEPMFSSCKEELGGKKVALFGSFGWGDGEWMRSWEESCKNNNILLVCDSVICSGTPDNQVISHCKQLGKKLIQASVS